MEAAAAHLLNFAQPFDCALLDQIVLIAMDGAHPQRGAANEFLVTMKDHPDMWRRADAILESSKQLQTKFFGLQVLSEAINTHWKVIPPEQREGIRSYVVGKIIALSSSDEQMKLHSTFLSRLNLVLVQILKQDWPHNWPTFISDIVGSSKTSESLCENNMKVLQLLSEEVFDYSKDSMTAAKMKMMKESLNEEFSQIFQLCEFILEASAKTSLVLCTLQTLQRFLTWIPLAYIFESNLISGLVTKFMSVPVFRTATVDCLTEIASLPPHDIPDAYRRPNMQMLLVHVVQCLAAILPRKVDLARAYEDGSDEDCLFIKRLALLLGTYLKSYMPIFDNPVDGSIMHEEVVVEALVYMVRVSSVDDEDIFKTCLEFWSHFCRELYLAETMSKNAAAAASGGAAAAGGGGGGNGSSTGVPSSSAAASSQTPATAPPLSIHMLRAKHVLFDSVLHQLRILMIDRMAKPEEVIIVEDDNGEIVREMTKDTEVIAQYKTMRETIVYLTNLNYEDSEAIMLEKLDLQVSGGQFSWNGLNTLCWAIGSISGAMGELDEKRFLVSVIKDLLRLCEEQRGKDNKAVVASNIMYIVGQYPRFLRAHWKFLKTVVNKLFEFMHEHHPGVQDMACDTFLKIAQKCKRKFMTSQVEDPQPFIMTLIGDLKKHIGDLQPHQVQSFYESVGTMLSDQGATIRLPRDEVVLRLMELQNLQWQARMHEGAQNIQTLLQPEVIRELSKILRINIRVCSSAGSVYLHQLSNVFNDMLNVYRCYSEQIIAAVAQQGPIAVRLTAFKAMRGVKADILDLFIACVEACADSEENFDNQAKELFNTNFMPALLTEVLQDYHSSPPVARDHKVLTLFSTAISVLRNLVAPEIPRILNAVFEKTLEMITANMLDYPEHRIAFFRFLHEANQHCFYALFSIPTNLQKLIIDSIVWAIKHTERNIAETGLEILLALLQNVTANEQIAQEFYSTFLIPLLQDVFGVLTDRLHKSGFKLQSTILMHLCHTIQRGQVVAPLHSMGPAVDNAQFLKEHLGGLLVKAFPNVTKPQVSQFVLGLFDLNMDQNQFKQHLRDFLITIKEFASEDNSELYNEEAEARQENMRQEQWQYMASVPGLLKPSEIEEDGADPEHR
mmetsp:Transcript_6605/g.11084  ORF Transcript_6605/g.11084 Transcript_6605/m.11084 type:complete len:1124 (+) Transcript_6605:163-3534(+)|eukprot:CAMPEP_0174963480 /NCGR_PEP_ID=MMETSP0004_2-20121128/5354_1 /TAXON_ID=420556 /ORGANISM="Ochromonas sp., Strain CCMP1393" /LENGTH=1123 /DNA_ID=CAMNT_0016212111 /DNA_START=124 /DNA_END=3495 /DNA_ORIENTATION=+